MTSIANEKVIVPFPNNIQFHLWSALYVSLKKQNLLAPRDKEEENKFHRVRLQFFDFKQILQSDCANLPLPLRYGSVLIFKKNTLQFKTEDFRQALSNGFILLISVDHEISRVRKIIEMQEHVNKPNHIDQTKNLINSCYFGRIDSVEWLSQLIEYTYHIRYNGDSRKLKVPLKLFLFKNNENLKLDHSLNEAFIAFLHRFLKTFFTHMKIFNLVATLKEKPNYQEIEILAQELGKITKEII